jgi:hypothetical protein
MYKYSVGTKIRDSIRPNIKYTVTHHFESTTHRNGQEEKQLWYAINDGEDIHDDKGLSSYIERFFEPCEE